MAVGVGFPPDEVVASSTHAVLGAGNIGRDETQYTLTSTYPFPTF